MSRIDEGANALHCSFSAQELDTTTGLTLRIFLLAQTLTFNDLGEKREGYKQELEGLLRRLSGRVARDMYVIIVHGFISNALVTKDRPDHIE